MRRVHALVIIYNYQPLIFVYLSIQHRFHAQICTHRDVNDDEKRELRERRAIFVDIYMYVCV